MFGLFQKKLSTEPYKGVRDFFPADYATLQYFMDTYRKTLSLYGYEEYNASILEPAEIYRTKTSDEIVNEQTYTFVDRGEREVTLRPEMTPTVSRMVAAKVRDYGLPLRWFSIPNVFRYEQPQKGRLREHWQLNVDLFGISTIGADVEAVTIASRLMHSFRLKNTDFEIHVNSRKIINFITEDIFNLSHNEARVLIRLIDRMEKVSEHDFKKELIRLVDEKAPQLELLLKSKNFEEFVSHLPEHARAHEGIVEVKTVLEKLDQLGIKNAVFSQTLMRGFDYYTGIVFEIFDTNPDNRRSLFGGGRYDGLTELFGAPAIPAVGFGMGDVTLRDTLALRGLLPAYTPHLQLHICIMDEKFNDDGSELAENLRDGGIAVSVDQSGKKIGDQIKFADKRGAQYVLVLGEEEIKTNVYKIKDLKTGVEKSVKSTDLISFFN